MATDQYRIALDAYNDAVARLYEAPRGQRLTADAEEIAGPAPDQAGAEEVASASEELTEATATLLDDDDPAVRESGVARLAAHAATDLAIAADLVRLGDPQDEARAALDESALPRSVLPEVEREVRIVLDADPSEGVPRTELEGDGRVPFFETESDPREALRKELNGAIDKVRDDATEAVMAGVGGLSGGILSDALGQLAGGLVQRLPSKFKFWYRAAVRLFNSAVEKLKKVFGALFGKAVDKLEEWLEDRITTAIANAVYEVPRLQDRVDELVTEAPDDTRWSEIGDRIKEVVERHASQKKIVMAVFKVLGLLRPAIQALLAGVPGRAVVDGAFVLGSGYALYAGGDYLDWYRTDDDGALDRVEGIRQTAEAALERPTPVG